MLRLLFVVLTAWPGLSEGQTDGVSVTCDFGGTVVKADDAALAQSVCRAVDKAAADFACFGLLPSDPVQINVVSSLSSTAGHPLALYLAANQSVEILDPSAMALKLTESSPYRMIPIDALFGSLVAHELAHAIFYQDRAPSPQNRIAQEYISYAMQYATLKPAVRAAMLDQFPRDAPVAVSEINLFYAEIAPVRFGTKVWRHFARPENGCSFVRKIMNGDAALPVGAAY